jgi:hypothetical protein
MEEFWKGVTDVTFYPVQYSANVGGQNLREKEFKFEKLAKNMKSPSINVTGFQEGDYIEGMGRASGCLLQTFWVNGAEERRTHEELRNTQNHEVVTGEDEPRHDGKRIFSPCGLMVRAFLDYFSGKAYPNASQIKTTLEKSTWQADISNRDIQRHELERKIQTPYATSSGNKLDILLRLADTMPNHRDIGGNDHRWRVKVFRLPKKTEEAIHDFFEDRAEQVIEAIVAKPFPYWHVHDLISLDTNCRRTTSLRTNYRWPIGRDDRREAFESYSPLMSFTRGAYRLAKTSIDNTVKPDIVLEDDGNVYVLRKEDVRFSTTKNPFMVSVAVQAKTVTKQSIPIEDLLHTVLGTREEDVGNFLRVLKKVDGLKMMQTGVYKSLMQKIIRLRPVVCRTLDGESVPADVALIFCTHKILYGPPQYLPTLHRSVQGPENVAKRLSVIAFEDSDPRSIGVETTRMLAAALLSQNEPKWFPSKNLVVQWCRNAVALWNCQSAIHYSTEKVFPFVRKHFLHYDDVFGKSAFLLRIIRSFEGDMRMVEYQAHHVDRLQTSSIDVRAVEEDEEDEDMPYPTHGFDQHVKPQLVFFLPDNLDYGVSKTCLGGRVGRVFDECTGINRRRPGMYTKDFEKRPFVQDVRRAQRQYIRLCHPPKVSRIEGDRSVTYRLALSDEFLAGALGGFELKIPGQVPMVASLNPFDLKQIVCAPALKQRGQEYNKVQGVFENKVQKVAKEVAKGMLANGQLRLDQIEKSFFNFLPAKNNFYNWFVKQDGEEFFLSRDGEEWLPWADLRESTWTYPVVHPPRANLLSLNIDDPYTGMATEDEIEQYAQTLGTRVLQRCLTYCQHYNTSFKMAVVARDGGTNQGSEPVDQYDPHAFKAFLALSRLAPYALRPSTRQPFQFQIENPLLFHRVKDILDKVLHARKHAVVTAWPPLADKEQRELFDFQKESVVRLLRETEQHRRRHFMRLPVGMGKTLITLTYLQRRGLEDAGFIVYTMPKSAFQSVIGEMITMGLRTSIYTKAKSENKTEKELYRSINENMWKDDPELRPRVYELSKDYDSKKKMWKKPLVFEKGRIIVLEHDALQIYKEALLPIIGNSILTIDEVHKCFYESTLRSGAALSLSRLALETIAFTGTPVLNKQGVLLLIRWLEANVKFRVNERNFVVATNAMISYTPRTTVKVTETNIAFPLETRAREQYDDPNTSFRTMVAICKEAARSKIAEEVARRVKEGHHVFAVAETSSDQVVLGQMIRALLPGALIACLNVKEGTALHAHQIDNHPSMDFTDEKVREGKVKDYDVVITRSKFNSGFNLTRCTVMVSGVYFGNEADRVQLKGRINRLSQNNDTVHYAFVFPANTVLELVHRDYAKVSHINKCLQANQCSNEDMKKLMEKEGSARRGKKRKSRKQ